MNELLFLSHILVTGIFCLIGLRLGRAALVAAVATQAVIANLLVLKQITLFGLTVTCSDVYIVGSILALSFLQEFFGEREARRATYAAFFSLALLATMSQLHLLYLPSSEDTMQPAYQQILGQMPRLALASFIAYAAAAFTAMITYRTTKNSYLSIALSQLIDTIVFAFVGLAGLVAHLGHVILVCLAVKGLVVAATTPAIMLARHLRKAE